MKEKVEGYGFDVAYTFDVIKSHWNGFAAKFNNPKWVIGISGGKDSTICAGLAAAIHGKENVIGVMMPCGDQKDISDSEEVIKILGINRCVANIGKAYEEIIDEVFFGCTGVISDDTKINLPPRLRSAVLYAVAQSCGGIVVNTSNLTEDYLGYCTLYGDTNGSYAPIHNLTVTEVIELGKFLNLPDSLILKTPADGLQDSCDEDRLGMKYADVDRCIRTNDYDEVVFQKAKAKFDANRFKLDMIRLPGPVFYYHDNFKQYFSYK